MNLYFAAILSAAIDRKLKENVIVLSKNHIKQHHASTLECCYAVLICSSLFCALSADATVMTHNLRGFSWDKIKYERNGVSLSYKNAKVAQQMCQQYTSGKQFCIAIMSPQSSISMKKGKLFVGGSNLEPLDGATSDCVLKS